MQAIAEDELIASLSGFLGHPEGDDIVVDLIIGGKFDEHHRALPPVAQGFDPCRWPLVVEDAIVLVILEIAIALQKAESLGSTIEKASGHHRFGIVERPPQALAVAGPDRQPI